MKLGVRILLTVILMGLVACGGSSGSDSGGSLDDANFCLGLNLKIIDGQTCSTAGSPIVRINLEGRDGKSAICTGNVIDTDKILTAAHCFIAFRVSNATVSVGSGEINVVQVDIHPDVGTDGVNLALFNDVAILTTERDLGLSTIPIIVSKDIETGDAIGVQGFGLDEDGNFGVSKGGAMIVSDVTSNHIAAAFTGDGSNPCNGDSGGPALLTIDDGTVGVVGVVSSGNPNTECLEGDVTLFANLQTDSILDFVLDRVPNTELR